jgi:hypothetical protein
MQHASSVCSPEMIRAIRVIRGRFQKLGGARLRGAALADKIGFLWLNTKLRGCQGMELATMSWRLRASCWIV